MPEKSWGCSSCWEGDAESAFAKINAFPTSSMLVDDSHLIIGTRICPECRQSFVTVFTETIDWDDGDDPQHRSTMPISETELADVAKLEEPAVYTALLALGHGRETIEWDLPRRGPKKINRAVGLQYRPHD